jgi:hypothetical protein
VLWPRALTCTWCLRISCAPILNPSFRNFEIEYPSFRNFGIELQILIEIIQMNCKDKVMVLVPIINKNFGKYFRILSNIKMSQIN